MPFLKVKQHKKLAKLFSVMMAFQETFRERANKFSKNAGGDLLPIAWPKKGQSLFDDHLPRALKKGQSVSLTVWLSWWMWGRNLWLHGTFQRCKDWSTRKESPKKRDSKMYDWHKSKWNWKERHERGTGTGSNGTSFSRALLLLSHSLAPLLPRLVQFQFENGSKREREPLVKLG